MPVLAATAAKADVPVYLDAVGTIKALNTVTVSPQVDGKLISVNFKEGEDVKKGDVLARIDPTTYQAQLDQAMAKKAQDEAQLANAKVDLDRYEKLAATNAINRQQADTQKALVAQDTALVQSDQAAIESAQATLGYTTIVAPIDGRTGIRQVDEGNIVHASSSPAIVVITQIKPISVMFNLPQQDLGQVNDAFAKGPLPVDALRPDNNAVIDRGTLRVIDNQVDPTTGTVKLKAEFPNAERAAVAGAVRQCAAVDRHAERRGGDPDRRGAARPERHLRLCGQGRQHRWRCARSWCRSRMRRRPWSRAAWRRRERVVTTGFARLTDGSKVDIGSSHRRAGRGAAQGARQRNGQRPGGGRPNATAMSVSSPFIHRPIATSLLGIAVMLGGALGYRWLPVSALPQVDFPTIQVTTQLPGASPDTIASLVTAPLERQFGQIPALADHDLVEFVRHQPDHAAIRPQPRHRRRRAGRAVGDQRRRLDAAAQPALSAGLLKVNPADAPIITLALTSDTIDHAHA